MSAYSELKSDFDHLEKRAWQLFEYGMKREHILTETLVSAYGQFERILGMEDIDEIHLNALAACRYLADVMAEQAKESGNEG